MDVWRHDLRCALRALWRTRLVTLVATLSLALAVAGNSTVFSLVYGIFFRPLPYPQPERICLIGERARDLPAGAISGVTVANFLDWQERQTSFEQLAAVQPRAASLALAGSEPPPSIRPPSSWTAGRFWGEGSPLGHRVSVQGISREIVGVVATVRHAVIVNPDFEPTLYIPWAQRPARNLAFTLRTAVPPATLAEAVRREVLAALGTYGVLAVGGLLLLVVAAASLLPAWRAASVDPVGALRPE